MDSEFCVLLIVRLSLFQDHESFLPTFSSSPSLASPSHLCPPFYLSSSYCSGGSQSSLASLDKIVFSNLPVLCEFGVLSPSQEQDWGFLLPQQVGTDWRELALINDCVRHYSRDVHTERRKMVPALDKRVVELNVTIWNLIFCLSSNLNFPNKILWCYFLILAWATFWNISEKHHLSYCSLFFCFFWM